MLISALLAATVIPGRDDIFRKRETSSRQTRLRCPALGSNAWPSAMQKRRSACRKDTRADLLKRHWAPVHGKKSCRLRRREMPVCVVHPVILLNYPFGVRTESGIREDVYFGKGY